MGTLLAPDNDDLQHWVMVRMIVSFRKRKYELILTDQARSRMNVRGIGLEELISVVEQGTPKRKHFE